MMGLLRQLAPAMVVTALSAGPVMAAEHTMPLALLAVQYGDEVYDRRDQSTYYDEASHLVRDRRGKLNIAETSLTYAAALVVTEQQTQRAYQIIEAVLEQQDRDEQSSTRGLFRWLDEKSSEPDVHATAYLAPVLAYLVKVVDDDALQERLHASARLALEGMLAKPPHPQDGFSAAMWAGAACSLGAVVDDPRGPEAGAKIVEGILALLRSRGLDGVHSPTFDALRIGGLRWAWQYAGDDEAREAAETALRIYYADMLQRYDPNTAMVTGAIGYAYAADYLGTTGVSRYLLACDLPSALAACRGVGPLVMYFALSDYTLPPELVTMAEERGGPIEVRTRTPEREQVGAAEASSTCTWVAPGLSLGTMSGPIDGSSIPVLATCDLPERPTSYFYVVGGPATVQSAQSGPLALCSFNFDGVGVMPRLKAGVRAILGRRDQIDRVIIGRHEWIGEPEAVGQNGVVAVKRGSSYLGVKILDVAVGTTPRMEIKPGVIEWYAEGNMDSLMLTVWGRRENYQVDKPLFDVRIGLLVEVAPATQFGSLEEFVEHVGKRRVNQDVKQFKMRVDDDNRRRIPGRHELTPLGEMHFAQFFQHTMTLADETLPLGLTEELLRNLLVSRTLPVELPSDYLWASPALNLQVGEDLSLLTVP